MTAPTRIDGTAQILRSGEARHRIGTAARAAGVSASAVRLWERQGLIQPKRTASGYRLYTDADLSRLRHIRRMRGERVNAPGIRRLLSSVGPSHDRHDDGRLDGRRLRALRHDRGYSLQSAARLAGLSASFLSAIERGAAGASVSTVHRLTRIYGVTMLDLFSPPVLGRRRIRRTERQVLQLGASVRIEQLAVGATQLEPQLFELAPGATSDGAYAHDGEEFMFVLDGALTVWLGEKEQYRLNTGDALTFPSTLPHRWRNRADGETRLLWINTPPTF